VVLGSVVPCGGDLGLVRARRRLVQSENLVAKFYDFGKRTNRLKLGYVPTIEDLTLQRIFMGLGGVFLLAVGAVAFALAITST
jgi:hypothetical protein